MDEPKSPPGWLTISQCLFFDPFLYCQDNYQQDSNEKEYGS